LTELGGTANTMGDLEHLVIASSISANPAVDLKGDRLLLIFKPGQKYVLARRTIERTIKPSCPAYEYETGTEKDGNKSQTNDVECGEHYKE
jgi:hypothetical protein